MIEVKVINSNINKREVISTNATTWGELKSELEAQSLASGDYQGVVKETSTTLSLDDAILPDQDFTLFVVVKKSKAGADYSNWSFHELRAECARRDSIQGRGGNYGTTNNMIDMLTADDGAGCTISSDLVARLEAVVTKLEQAFDEAEEGYEMDSPVDPSVPSQEELEYARQLEEQL